MKILHSADWHLDSPFAGLPQQEILRRTVAGKITPPSLSGQQFPPGLEAICLKAMAHDPADRYESAMDMRADINASMAGYAAVAEKASAIRTMFLFVRLAIYGYSAKIMPNYMGLLSSPINLDVL